VKIMIFSRRQYVSAKMIGKVSYEEPIDYSHSAFFIWLFLAIFWISFNLIATPGFNVFQIVVLAMVAGLFLVIWLACRRQVEKLPFVFYSAVYVVFHFGMILMALIQPTLLLEQRSWSSWYFSDFFVREAYNVAIVFFFGLCAAALGSYGRQTPNQLAMSHGEQGGHSSGKINTFFTYALGVACLIWAFVVLIVLGISDYAQYNEGARGVSSFSVGILKFIYTVITALLFYGLLYSKDWRPLIVIFSVWSAVAFPIGLRGEVLFPLVMAAPILVIQGRIRLRPVMLGVLVIAGLLASSFVRTYRNDPSFQSAAENTSVLMGLAELGGSLRPAYEVRRWIDTGVDDFRWGETFYAPFERTFQSIMPFYQRLPAREDMRLMNVAIVEHTNGGNYGFSIAAESYINFGFAGAVVIGFLSGLLMLRFGRGMAMSRIEIVVPALAFALLYHIRQSFVGAYGSFVMFVICGIVILAVVKSLDTRRASGFVR
jgi:oligosaccharide repeat unit polymerase